jgi:3D (Asp-Asp-Asp) domain-containing protein
LTNNSRGRLAAASALISALVLLASLASGQVVAQARGLANDRGAIQHLLAQGRLLKSDLAAEQNREKRLERRLNAPSYKPTQKDHIVLAAAIQASWAEVIVLDRQLVETAKERHRVRLRAASLVPKARALKMAIRRQLVNVRASLIQLYDISRISLLEQVLEAKSLTDYLAQQSIVSQIGADDVATLARARVQRSKLLAVERAYTTMARELRALIRDEKAQRDLFKLNAAHVTAMLAEVRRIDARLVAEARRRKAAAAAAAAAAVAGTKGPNKGLPAPPASAPGTWSTYLVTAYCDHGLTASGSRTKPGSMAATLPFGTRLYVPGYGSGVVVDRGGAVGPGHVDLWMTSCSAALTWGAQVIPIEILG